MAEYGEWNRPGATLSEVTAQKEYAIERELIVRGIKSGRLEYREGAIWGNSYLRLLRSQLEAYISDQLGKDYLERVIVQTELKKVKSQINSLKKELRLLEEQRSDLEASLKLRG